MMRLLSYSGRSDDESKEIGDGCDGNADSGVLHGDTDLNEQWPLQILFAQIAVALDDDEHVVDTNTHQQER